MRVRHNVQSSNYLKSRRNRVGLGSVCVQGDARGHGASPRPRKATARRIDAAYGWRVYARIRTHGIFEGGYCPEMVELERACCTPGGPAGTTGTNLRVKKFIGPRARAAGAGRVQRPP